MVGKQLHLARYDDFIAGRQTLGNRDPARLPDSQSDRAQIGLAVLYHIHHFLIAARPNRLLGHHQDRLCGRHRQFDLYELAGLQPVIGVVKPGTDTDAATGKLHAG